MSQLFIGPSLWTKSSATAYGLKQNKTKQKTPLYKMGVFIFTDEENWGSFREVKKFKSHGIVLALRMHEIKLLLY